MADFVCVKAFVKPPLAEVARGFLESQGVEAVVVPDSSRGILRGVGGGALPVGGAKLMVKQEDAQKAADLLKDFEEK